MRPHEPDPLPPPCGRHKWMAPNDSVRIVQKEVGGRNLSLGGGLRDEGGGQHFFSTQGEKEVEGRILSSIIEEIGTWWRLG